MFPLLFLACQKDDDFKNLKQKEQIDKDFIQEVNFKEFSLGEIEDYQVIERLHLSRHKRFSTSSNYKPIEGTDLSIRVDDIIFLENEQVESYTFGVKDNSNPNRVVNLLMNHIKETGVYTAYLLDYDFDATDISYIEDGRLDLLDFTGKTEATLFTGGLTTFVSGNGKPCFEPVQSIGVHRCKGEGHHLPGDPDCKFPDSAYYYTYVTMRIVDCDYGDGGGSGGGGGSHNSGDNTPSTSPPNTDNPDNDNGEATEQDEDIVDGGGGMTMPVVHLKEPEEPDPCESVKTQFEDEGFKNKINLLKGKTNATKEWGFSESSDQGVSALSEGKKHSWKFNVTNTSTGYSHSHPNTPMFSLRDFLKFRDVINSVSHNDNADVSDAYGVMIYGAGNDQVNYMLKFIGNYADVYTHFNNNPLSDEELKI